MVEAVLAYNGLPILLSTDKYTIENEIYTAHGTLYKFDLKKGNKTFEVGFFNKDDFKKDDQSRCRMGYYRTSSFYKYKNGELILPNLQDAILSGWGYEHYLPLNDASEFQKTEWGLKLADNGDIVTTLRFNPEPPYTFYYLNKEYIFKVKKEPNVNLPPRYQSPSDYPPVNPDINSPDYSVVNRKEVDLMTESTGIFYSKNLGDFITSWGITDAEKQTCAIGMTYICWQISFLKKELDKIAINTLNDIYDAFYLKYYSDNDAPYINLPLCDRMIGDILWSWGYYYAPQYFDFDPIFPTEYTPEYEMILKQYYVATVNFYRGIYYKTVQQLFPDDSGGTIAERSDNRIKYLIKILPSSALGILPLNYRIDILKMLANNRMYNSDELIALKIIKSVSIQEANEFLEKLLFVTISWGDANVTLFEALYRRVQDEILWVGDDNRKEYMLTMYFLWFVSSYNPMNSDTDSDVLADSYGNSPITIKYQSELSFGFYMDNMNFDFANKNINVKEERTEIRPSYKEYGSDIHTYYEKIGSYNIYQAITLNEYKDDDFAIKIPLIGLDSSPTGDTTALLPLFFLKYMDDKGDQEDLWTGIGLAFDIALTFTGIGNISKLRHLRHLSKIGKVIRGTATGAETVFIVRAGYYGAQGAAGLIEFTASITQLFLQYYTNGCQVYQQAVTTNINDSNPEAPIPEDPNIAYQRCKTIDNILFWMQMGSLGMDLIAGKMIRKKAKELKDMGYPPQWDLTEYLALKNKFEELNGINILSDYNHMINNIPDGSVIAGKLTTDIEKINFYNDFGMVERNAEFWSKLTANNGVAVDNWKQFRNLDITDEITNVALLSDAMLAPRYIAYYSNNNLKEAIASLERAVREKFIKKHGGISPLPSGPGFIKAWQKMGDDLGEFANNVPVLRQFDNLPDNMIDSIVYEMKHADRGPGVRSRIKQSPGDINNVMKPMLENPAFAYAAKDNINVRWLDWRRSIFCKHIFGVGKKFETLCTTGLAKIGSPTYSLVRSKILTLTGKNLNEYQMFSSVQLKIGNTENYFVADQLFVKYGTDQFGKEIIEDIIVLETKLQGTTNLSARQLEALQAAAQGYFVRSKKANSKYNKKIELNPQSKKLKFSGSPTFIKMFDNADGNAINDLSLL